MSKLYTLLLLSLLIGAGTGLYGQKLNATASKTNNVKIPIDMVLYNNYPNPFNPETKISFHLKKRMWIELIVNNILGQKVLILKEDIYEPGIYTVVWDGKDSNKNPVSSGVYFYQLKDEKQNTITKKMMLAH